MKYLKMMGLAAATATALLALAGLATASAETTLCKATEAPCSEVNSLGAGTKFEASGPGVLTAFGGFSQTECSKISSSGVIESATTPGGKLTSLQFSECNNTVTVIKTGSGLIHFDAGHNGTVTTSGFEVEVNAGITCVFGGSITEGATLKGGSPAVMAVTATIARVGGSVFCPATGVYHAEYTVSVPTPLYVSKGV